MNALQMIFMIVIAASGFPLGLVLAYFTKEELKPGRKYFKMIFLVSVLVFLADVILSVIYPKQLALLFLGIISIFIGLLALANFIMSKKY